MAISHQPLAEAIAHVISTETGGKAIALEGGWGSGKSSVIEMLRKKLEGNAQDAATRVFIFDAWSHQGDPLRRSFLETLTQFCCEELTTDQVKILEKKKKREITGIEREIDQKSTPILTSKWPILVMAMATAYPVALVCLGPALKQTENGWIGFYSIMVFAIIALAPAAWLCYVCIWVCRSQSDTQLAKAAQWISLWGKKVNETTKTKTQETIGPTTIEFQGYFSDLMGGYLYDNGTRKIVLVLDNLDRVPPSTARELWTTLRIFAECCEKQENSVWATRAWIIVPYDPSAACRLWDDIERSHDLNEDANSHKSPKLSSAFLDKTFQIRFDVPPLLIADWKAYLAKQIVIAIPGLESNEDAIHKVYLLSRQMSQEKRRPPTPRHLKLFINDIGALYRRYSTHFPTEHLALYTLLRRQGHHDIRHWLLNNTEEHARFAAILGGESFVESLCAMAYGTTDTENAQDLLLRTPIEACFAHGDSEGLKKISAVHGFAEVLETLCDDNVMNFGTDEEKVVNTVNAIVSSNLINSLAKPVSISLTHFIASLLENAEWVALNKTTAMTVAKSIDLNIRTESIQVAIDKLASIHAAQDNAQHIDGESWRVGFEIIAKSLEQSNLLKQFAGSMKLPAKEFASPIFISFVQQNDLQLRKYSSLVSLDVEDMTYPDSLIPNSNTAWTKAAADTFRGITWMSGVNAVSTRIFNALKPRFQCDDELGSEEVSLLVQIYRCLEQVNFSVTQSAIEDLAKSGHLYRRIANLRKKKQSPEFFHLLLWIIRHADFSKSPSSPANSVPGYEIVTKIEDNGTELNGLVTHVIDYCKLYPDQHILSDILDQSDILPIFAEKVLEQLKNDGVLSTYLDATLFLDNFDNLDKLFGKGAFCSLEELAQYLLTNDLFAVSLDKVAISDSVMSPVLCLVEHGAILRNKIFNVNVRKWIESKSSDEWLHSFSVNDSQLKVLIAYRRFQTDFVVAKYLSEALEKFLTNLLKESPSTTMVPDGWDTVVGSISDNHQATIASKVLERADAPDLNLLPVLPFYADQLAKATLEYNRDSFVRNVLLAILSTGNSQGISWIQKVLLPSSSVWSSAPPADQATFSQELNNIVADESKVELHELVKTIGQQLKLVLISEPDAE